MKLSWKTTELITILVLACGAISTDRAIARRAADGADTAASTPVLPVPAGWPRSFEKDGETVVMYAPQVDAWKDHTEIRFRAAVVVTPKNSTQPQYGVVAGQADARRCIATKSYD